MKSKTEINIKFLGISISLSLIFSIIIYLIQAFFPFKDSVSGNIGVLMIFQGIYLLLLKKINYLRFTNN